MATNDFQTFASAGGANVISQAAYLALAAKATGFSSGIAASAQLNKVWRQSSIMSSMIGQFIADNSGANAIDDGTIATLEANFVLAVQAINQIKLSSDLNLYVNPSTGNDINNGLTPTTAFRSIQAAFNSGYTAYNYDQHNLIVNLAAGTYTGPVVLTGLPVGCGTVELLGSATAPSSYVISVTNANAITAGGGCNLTVTGVTIQATGTSTQIRGLGYGIVSAQGWIAVQNCILGSCTTTQILSNYSGVATVSGCTFTGSSIYGMVAAEGALLWAAGTTLTFNTPTYSGATVLSQVNGSIIMVGTTITGTATGQRFLSQYNSIIQTNGAGLNFLPGTIAGSPATNASNTASSYYT